MGKNVKKLFWYVGISSLFFERSIFVLYLIYKGLNLGEIAFFQSTINIAMLVGEIPTGIIADNIGKKKALLMGGILMIIYYLSMLFSDTFVMFVLGAVVFGIGSTFVSGTNTAYLYDLMDDKISSVKMLGRLSTIITGAIGLAMVIGGYLQKTSWESVMWLGVSAQIIGVCILLSLPNIVVRASCSKKIFLYDVFRAFKNKGFLRKALFLLGLNEGIVSSIYILAQAILNQFGMRTEHIAWVFCIETLLSVVAFSQIETFINKFGRKKVMVVTIAGTALAFLGLNTSKTLVISCLVLLISVLNNCYTTVLLDEFNNVIEKDIRATAISCFNMISALFMACIFWSISVIGDNYIFMFSILGAISTLSLFGLFKYIAKSSDNS
ncbi:MAG: MFS transporter [Acidaminococcaceae bacterium]|jgi:MFS family permease|nr:MFS transporter [Acidaminococcaceae bacterium]